MSSEVVKRGKAVFLENELLVGLEMIESLEKVTDLMLYFLDREHVKFTYILMQSESDDLDSFLRQYKRNTDLLLSIEGDRMMSVLICQETDVEGGYRFAERLIRKLNIDHEKQSICCDVMTVSTTRYTSKQVIYRLFETYVKSMRKDNKEKSGEIEFSTLS